LDQNKRKSGDAGRPRTISNEMAEVHVKQSFQLNIMKY